MGLYEQLAAVIDDFYEASISPGHWTHALERCTGFLGGAGADIYISSDKKPPHIAFCGIPMELMDEYLKYYHNDNKRVTKILASPESTLLTDNDVVSRTEVASSPYYQDFLFKNGLGYYVGAAAMVREKESAFLGFHWRYGVDCYTDENFRRIRLVLPHIKRAAEIFNRLELSIEREKRFTETLAALSIGIVVFDPNGRIALINDVAESLLSSVRGIRLKSTTIEFDNTISNSEMQKLVEGTIKRSDDLNPNTMLYRDPASGKSNSMTMARLPNSVRTEEPLGAVMVVSDSESSLPVDVERLLTNAYKLTKSEAEVARFLANGERLRTYAEHSGKSYETVRSHTKHVMEKMEVTSQHELIRTLLNIFRTVPRR